MSEKKMTWSDLEKGDIVLIHPDDWSGLMSGLGASGLITNMIDAAGATLARDDDGVAPRGEARVLRAMGLPFTLESIDEPDDADVIVKRVLADRRIMADNMVLHAATPPGLKFTFHGELADQHAAIENRRCRLKMLGVDDAGMGRVEAAAARNSRLGGLHEDTFVEVERRILRGETPSTVVDDVAHGDDSKEGGER